MSGTSATSLNGKGLASLSDPRAPRIQAALTKMLMAGLSRVGQVKTASDGVALAKSILEDAEHLRDSEKVEE